MANSLARFVPVTLVVASGSLFHGCAPENTFVEPPPPSVTVATIQPEAVTTYNEYPGRTEGIQLVEIRARVTGFLESIDFAAGSRVAAGRQLFTIEDTAYRAAAEAASANLARAVADLGIAANNRDRRVRAAETNAVSQLDVDAAEAEVKGRQADVLSARAVLLDARNNLGYCTVTSPVNGIVSRHFVDIGNLVNGGTGTLLTTVVNDDRIHAFFEVNQRRILPRLGERKRLAEGDFEREGFVVRIRLADGTVYDNDGFVDFIDNKIDAETGTIEVRALFENPEQKLAHGLFCTVMVPQENAEAMLVPRQAVQRDIAGRFVLCVGDDDIVVRQPVATGAYIDDRQIVEGLEPGSRVIVSGLQRAREGIKVTPVPLEAEQPDG